LKHAFVLALMLMVGGCGDTTPTEAGKPDDADTPEAVQKKELAAQKLSIEQAAEEATKLIEADAKAEIDAANASGGVAQ
jgi:ribosome biogenesis SPOUT family RNA methylase Rps3